MKRGAKLLGNGFYYWYAPLYMAALGWPVLPLEPGGERVATVARDGLKEATTDAAKIGWWATVGGVTDRFWWGVVPPAGVVVLELDSAAVKAVCDRWPMAVMAMLSISPTRWLWYLPAPVAWKAAGKKIVSKQAGLVVKGMGRDAVPIPGNDKNAGAWWGLPRLPERLPQAPEGLFDWVVGK